MFSITICYKIDIIKHEEIYAKRKKVLKHKEVWNTTNNKQNSREKQKNVLWNKYNDAQTSTMLKKKMKDKTKQKSTKC